MPQCFRVRDLTQLLATRFLHPYSVIFRGSADKNVAGHQAKRTIVLRRCRSQNRHVIIIVRARLQRYQMSSENTITQQNITYKMINNWIAENRFVHFLSNPLQNLI